MVCGSILLRCATVIIQAPNNQNTLIVQLIPLVQQSAVICIIIPYAGFYREELIIM